MGEVYKAHDSRLNRTVAVKVLPPHIADDPDLRQRFEREAQAVAALSHPHICPVFDVGSQDGTDYLVMEYLEGDTLAQRLETGPLPPDQVLRYAEELADALDKAHRQGIVHRDLKPGNIMITKAGTKLLDFGLAKLRDAADSGASAATMPTRAATLTAHGAILGTFQYMAPEQLEGEEADLRTDIFAFGAVVYEMATGKKAFEGKTQASLIGSILKDQPAPISSVQTLVPAALDQIVQTCLAKDPDDRWQSAGDLARQLRHLTGATSQPSAVVPSVPAPAPAGSSGLNLGTVAAVAVIAAVVSGGATWALLGPEAEVPRPRRTFEIGLGALSPIPVISARVEPALSPDGTRLAYTAVADGNVQLHVRFLDQTETRVLAGTTNAYAPFFSPDGEWIGYFDPPRGLLKKISVQGGTPVTLGSANGNRGATWLSDGSIIFSISNNVPALFRVPDSGGTPEAVTTLSNGGTHFWPHILPDQETVLFTRYGGANNIETGEIVARSLVTGEERTVVDVGFAGRYVESGHLVFARQGSLWAVAFDPETLETSGQEVVVLQGLEMSNNDDPAFAHSREGLMVYLPGDALTQTGAEGTIPRSLVWMSEDGQEEALPLPVRQYAGPRLSPDGRRLAVAQWDGDAWHLWVYDVESGASLRLTQDGGGRDMLPVWTPDGTRIVFHANTADNAALGDLFVIPADGSGPARQLTSVENAGDYPTSVSPDGREVVFTRILDPGPNLHREIMVVSLDGDGEARPILEGDFAFGNASLSPDGNWLAYRSDESGQFEIYIQPYPGPGAKTPVSIGGGTGAVWSTDGTTLFYRAGEDFMAVDLETEPGLTVGRPRPLFDGEMYFRVTGGGGRQYHVAPDGRLVLIRRGEALAEVGADDPAHLVVVEDWFADLRAAAPVDP